MKNKTMKDMVSLDNYERWDKGQPLIEEKPPEIKQPDPPKLDNLFTIAQVDLSKVSAFLEGRRRGIRNKEGVLFIGYDVKLKLKDGKEIGGWMNGKDFLSLRRGALAKKDEILIGDVER